MKWLFFALLALNIAIFGGMTLPKVMEKQEAEMMAQRKEASARMTRDSADLPQPMVKPSDVGASETPASAVASAPSGNWLTDNGGAADVYIEPTDTEEDTAKQTAAKFRPKKKPCGAASMHRAIIIRATLSVSPSLQRQDRETAV